MDERITVTVAADVDAELVAEQLRAAGMTVDQVLRAVGVITGTVAAEQRAALADVPGVLAVEPEQAFGLPPPDAEIQ
jgi:cation transporter-like permease